MAKVFKSVCLGVILALVLSLVGLVLPVSVSAAEELLIDDDFDSDTTGSDPSGWGIDESGGSIQVVDTVYYGASGKSVEIVSDTAYVNMGKGYGNTSGTITYEICARSSSVTSGETITIYGGGDGLGPWVTMAYNSGQLSYYDGSWHNVYSISADTWYKIKIVADVGANTFDIYVDNMTTPAATDCGFRESVTYLGQLSVGDWGTNDVAAYADEVKVYGYTEVWVDNNFDESTIGWGVDHFDNIQDGIDAVVGSTVHVAAGTYDGFVVDNKDNIEILGANGAVVTGYGDSGANGYTYAVMAYVNESENFTIDNLDFDGSGLTGDFQVVEGICCVNSIGSITNVDISNVCGTYSGMGIYVGRFPEPNETVNISGTTVAGSPIGIMAQNDTVNVDECMVTGSEGQVGILALDGAELTVSSSKVSGFPYGVMVGANSAYEEEMRLEGENPCQARICCCCPTDGNDYGIYDNVFGIYVDEDGQATVCGNTIEDNATGIYLDSGSNIIKGNDILSNDEMLTGIHINTTSVSNVINYNNIEGNTPNGVYQEPTDGSVDAEYNWWDDENGPGGSGPGDGDTVNDYVDYDPWLTLPYGQVETATGTGIASFSCCSGAIEELEAIAEGDLPSNGDKPDAEFPHGFFSFKITELEAGATVTVTITLPEDVPEGTEWWKYDSELGWSSIDIGDDDGDNVITITLTDGGTGDQDGTENGEILEPGGPGLPEEEEECETPTARISASVLMGETPLTVQFRGSSDQSDVTWDWSFDTGDNSDSRSPSYTFQNEGTYTVRLKVTNECGKSATDSVTILVEDSGFPPNLVIRDIHIDPVYAESRQAIGITAKVVNEGGAWGSDDIELFINGDFEQSVPVGLAAGTATPISFTVYKVPAGEYQVTIGNATATFYVMEEESQQGASGYGPLDTGGIIAIIVIAIILVGGVVLIFLLTRRP